jgi:hypothetical protein
MSSRIVRNNNNSKVNGLNRKESKYNHIQDRENNN